MVTVNAGAPFALPLFLCPLSPLSCLMSCQAHCCSGLAIASLSAAHLQIQKKSICPDPQACSQGQSPPNSTPPNSSATDSLLGYYKALGKRRITTSMKIKDKTTKNPAKGFCPEVILHPHLIPQEMFLVVTTREMLVASSGQGSRIPLNSLYSQNGPHIKEVSG